MEPKFFSEVIVHPNHSLTFGDWIHRVDDFFGWYCCFFCGRWMMFHDAWVCTKRFRKVFFISNVLYIVIT